MFSTAFLYLQIVLVIFWQKGISKKATRKMLVKLTIELGLIPRQVLATWVAVMVVDRFGRRILLILSAGEIVAYLFISRAVLRPSEALGKT